MKNFQYKNKVFIATIAILASLSYVPLAHASVIGDFFNKILGKSQVVGGGSGTVTPLHSSGGGGTWGSITGTLSSQTDLQTVLDTFVPYTGAGNDVDLGSNALSVNGLRATGSLLHLGTVVTDAIISGSSITATRTYTLPDATGTFALTSDIPALETDGTPNGTQTLLNLKSGTNITLTDDTFGGITIDATGGGGGTPGGSNTQLQYNNSSAFGGISGATSNGTSLTLSSGNLKLSGATSGTGTLNAPAVASTYTWTLPAGTDTLVGLATTDTLTNKDLTSGTNTFPTFNQNTTGSSAKWTTARNLAGNSVDGSANVAFANKFIVQGTTDAGLSGAQFLGALGTGIVKNTTTTGVLSIAVAGDFPTLNQNTTGSAGTLTTPRAIYGNNFDGSASLTQIIASTYGGTGNGFTKFTGPATSEKTFTLPNASATILTDNAVVTVAQGGTGLGTLTANNLIIGNGTSTPSFLAPSTSGKIPVSNGTTFVMSTPTFPNASATSGKIIKSDGTNWVASTETYAVPGTNKNVMKSDGTNWTSSAPSFEGMVEATSFEDGGTSLANTTYVIELYAEYAYTINEMRIIAGSGTVTANLKINSTSVTSCSAVSVTTTIASCTASGANTVAVGDKITLVTTSTSSLNDLQATIKTTRN